METREKIIEMAKCLGQIIKEDEVIKKLEAAQEAYNTDVDVLLLTTEYTVQQQLLTEAFSKDESKETIDKINARINAIYNQVIETPAYKAYEAAQNEVPWRWQGPPADPQWPHGSPWKPAWQDKSPRHDEAIPSVLHLGVRRPADDRCIFRG